MSVASRRARHRHSSDSRSRRRRTRDRRSRLGQTSAAARRTRAKPARRSPAGAPARRRRRAFRTALSTATTRSRPSNRRAIARRTHRREVKGASAQLREVSRSTALRASARLGLCRAEVPTERTVRQLPLPNSPPNSAMAIARRKRHHPASLRQDVARARPPRSELRADDRCRRTVPTKYSHSANSKPWASSRPASSPVIQASP